MMSETELQKVESVAFQINSDDDVGLGLVWKDGSLYLSISKIVLTDGERWYAIPFKDLHDIKAGDEGCISLKIEGAEIKVKGENADRLMALRHLLLPLIDRKVEDGRLMEELLKILLLGIKNREVIASLLKRDLSTVDDLMESAERLGYVLGDEVTPKGKSILPDKDREMMRKAGVDI